MSGIVWESRDLIYYLAAMLFVDKLTLPKRHIEPVDRIEQTLRLRCWGKLASWGVFDDYMFLFFLMAIYIYIYIAFFFFFFFFLFRAAPTVYGSSQARGGIRATATSLCHSHSNARSEPRLQPAPWLMATPDPLPTEQGQGLNLQPHVS